jgi:hypothetical protein
MIDEAIYCSARPLLLSCYSTHIGKETDPMKTCLTLLMSLALLGYFIGCSSSSGSSSSTTQTSDATPPSATTRPIPPDSIFAKVKMGEDKEAVYADIGQPTSTYGPYPTGKSFIPFHSSSDTVRIGAHYKGVGIVTFGNDSSATSGFSVVDVSYDPNDPGQ